MKSKLLLLLLVAAAILLEAAAIYSFYNKHTTQVSGNAVVQADATREQ